MPGLRLGTNEIVRWGMGPSEMPELAGLLAEALTGDPARAATGVAVLRRRFDRLHHLHV